MGTPLAPGVEQARVPLNCLSGKSPGEADAVGPVSPEDLLVWGFVNLTEMLAAGLGWFVLGPWWPRAPHLLPAVSFLKPPCPLLFSFSSCPC